MSEIKAVWEKTRLRFLLGGLVFVAGAICADAAGGGFARLLCSLFFAGILAVVIGPPLCELLAEPIRSQYEEAIAGYKQLAVDYPEEIQPYLALIEIAAIDLKDPERARGFYRRGMTLFTDPGRRDVLSRHFEAQLSRLTGKPDWLKEQDARSLEVQKKTDSAPVDEPDGLAHRRFHPGGYNRL